MQYFFNCSKDKCNHFTRTHDNILSSICLQQQRLPPGLQNVFGSLRAMTSRSIASGSLSVKETSVGYRSHKKLRVSEKHFLLQVIKMDVHDFKEIILSCPAAENELKKKFQCLFSNNVKLCECSSTRSFCNFAPTHFHRRSSVPLFLTSYLSSSFPETPASRQLGIILVSDALQS